MELHHYLVRLALPQHAECIFEMIENLNPKLESRGHSINACSETQCLVKAQDEDMSRTADVRQRRHCKLCHLLVGDDGLLMETAMCAKSDFLFILSDLRSAAPNGSLPSVI